MSKLKITHDELIEKIFDEYQKAKKSHYVDLFLSSLSSNNLHFRSGLPVYAIMQTFPRHKFTHRDKCDDITTPCNYCAGYKDMTIDFSFLNDIFNELGGVIPSVDSYYYYLVETNKLEMVKPTKEDFRIFKDILDIILQTNEDETLKKTVLSKINNIKGFKSNVQQRQALLETLGYCSILETQRHKGFLSRYINFANAPRKTHSSDWSYPVDFWLGKDGINKEAFKFWFSDYPELEQFWK